MGSLWRSRSRKRWDLRQARHRGVWHRSVQRALPRIRPPARPGLGGAHAADRILDRHGRPLLDDGPRVHRVRVVVAEAAPRAGLLVESDKVTAYCPRCGTALSDAEVALGYDTAEDPSIEVRFPIVEASIRRWSGRRSSCGRPPRGRCPRTPAWPWTPRRRTPCFGSARSGHRGRRPRVDVALGGLDRRAHGGRSGLEDARYDPPYPNIEDAHRVVAGAFVSLEDGTGIVHMAPAFGAADLELGLAQGWAVFKPVGDDGRFTDLGPAFVRGVFVKDADPAIVVDLRERGLLQRSGTIEHTTRSAGGARRHSSTTRDPRGTCGRPR